MYIFDGHSDLWTDIDRKRSQGINTAIADTHLSRWRDGNIAGGFFPVWPDPSSETSTIDQVNSMIKNLQIELDESASVMTLVRNITEYKMAIDNEKLAVILGSEGLSFIGEDVDMIDKLYDIGFRELSLTWNESNLLAGGSFAPLDHGLTEVGKKAVRRIIDLNMIFDLAHANSTTFYDSIKLLDRPFMVSHGSCYELCEHPRNLTDDQIKRIAEFDGVLGICSFAPFIASDIEKQTVKQYVAHLIHVADLVGVDHVGIGFDFIDFLEAGTPGNEFDYKLRGLETIKQTNNLIDEMRNSGFNESEINLICHGNWERLINRLLI